MLPHRLCVAEVMVLLDETIEERFVRCAPDLAKLQWPHVRKSTVDRSGVHPGGRRHSTLDDVIVWPRAYRWKLDEPRTVELEHKAAANHVAKLAVGLHPAPGFTQKLRESAAACLGVLGNKATDEQDVRRGDHTAAVLQLHFHRDGA
jgi:hypothetical protein